MTLGGVEALNNLAKLKKNKFKQLYHEDNYLYLCLYLYLYCYCYYFKYIKDSSVFIAELAEVMWV